MTFYLSGSRNPMTEIQWQALQKQQQEEVCPLDKSFPQRLTITFQDVSNRFKDLKPSSPLYLSGTMPAVVNVVAYSLLFPKSSGGLLFWDSTISVNTSRLNSGPVVVPFVFKPTPSKIVWPARPKTEYGDQGIFVTINRDGKETYFFSKQPIDEEKSVPSSLHIENLTLKTDKPNHVAITVPYSNASKVAKVFSHSVVS